MTEPVHNEEPATPISGGPVAGRSTASDTAQSSVSPPGVRGLLVNLALPLILIVAALGIGAVLISSPPDVPKSEPETLAPVVGLAELVPEVVQVFVDAYGEVMPSREVRVQPEVSGRVVELNNKLEPGGLVSAGELLFKIDPADYEIAVALAKANLDVARHEVSRISAGIEALHGRGQQLDVEIDYLQWNADRLAGLAENDSVGEAEARDARTQLKSLKATRLSLDGDIAERKKAVESAIAGVRVAERRLESAQLALERTQVTAPFDAVVIWENVETGQLVGPQAAIARLAATDEFWAEAAVPVARLKDLRFAVDDADNASGVTVSLSAGADEIVREGVALRPLGDLDPLGRMARVLVSIRDPLGLADAAGTARRVLLGSYVRLHIEAGMLQEVYAIPRKALRENDRIWVRDGEGHLAIRPVRIVWRRHEDVLVHNGFEAGDQLVTSHLASVVPGMPLRVRNEPSSPVADASDSSTDAASAPQ